MTIPNFTAELSLQPTTEISQEPACGPYEGVINLATRKSLVYPAFFKILHRGHVGYCCDCQGRGANTACDCFACMSV